MRSDDQGAGLVHRGSFQVRKEAERLHGGWIDERHWKNRSFPVIRRIPNTVLPLNGNASAHRLKQRIRGDAVAREHHYAAVKGEVEYVLYLTLAEGIDGLHYQEHRPLGLQPSQRIGELDRIVRGEVPNAVPAVIVRAERRRVRSEIDKS